MVVDASWWHGLHGRCWSVAVARVARPESFRTDAVLVARAVSTPPGLVAELPYIVYKTGPWGKTLDADYNTVILQWST